MRRAAWLLDGLARLLCGAGAAVMCIMMMVTVADVVLRSLFAFPIFGTFDLVELCLVTMVFLVLPETFRREQHVTIEVLDHLAPARTIRALRVVALLLAVLFLVLAFWHGVRPAHDTWRFGEHTLDLGIPRFLHWLPILFGLAVSALVGLRLLAVPPRGERPAS